MTENYLVKLFEHNLWANHRIIEACMVLNDEQLDTEPRSATRGSIRLTLSHLVTSQMGYLNLLTLPVDARPKINLAFDELLESARISGEGILSFVRGNPSDLSKHQLQTRDGYLVEPWVVLVQVINHATEHREQIKSMLSSLEITPPDIDGWTYGEASHALIPM